jgi:hypothetical protein
VLAVLAQHQEVQMEVMVLILHLVLLQLPQ